MPSRFEEGERPKLQNRSPIFCDKKAHKAQNQLTIIQVFYFCAFCAFLPLVLLRGYCLRM